MAVSGSRKAQVGIRVRAYPILARAVEEGVAAGYRHAHKHTDTPSEELLREHLERDVLSAISEVFDLD